MFTEMAWTQASGRVKTEVTASLVGKIHGVINAYGTEQMFGMLHAMRTNRVVTMASARLPIVCIDVEA